MAKLNILISGGTGSGKTTMLNILSGFIPATERIITIEDSAELQLQQEHVCRLETRPPNVEGKGEITDRDLVKNCLRMRPDRIIVGEVRGAEVIDMLQAMNTGHEGSMTTIHANTARDALLRLETMISLSGITIQEKAMRQMISSSINVIIQLVRHSDGVPPHDVPLGNHRDGERRHQHAGYLRFRTPWHERTGDDYGEICGHRGAAAVCRALPALRVAAPRRDLQSPQPAHGATISIESRREEANESDKPNV